MEDPTPLSGKLANFQPLAVYYGWRNQMTLLAHIAIIWTGILVLLVGTLYLNPKPAEQIAQDIRDDGF